MSIDIMDSKWLEMTNQIAGEYRVRARTEQLIIELAKEFEFA